MDGAKRKIKRGRDEESLWEKKECHATWRRRYSKMSGESVNYKRGGTLFIEMSALERKRGKTGV